jgi:Ca2+-binding RTX toxin-like protein
MTTTTTPTNGPAALEAKALHGVAGGNYTDRNGTPGNDTITTGDGMDKVFAGAGHDVISTGGGTDEVHAGSGNDNVDAGAGDDKVFGESWGDSYGNDTLNGGAGSDELHGDAPGEQWSGGHDQLNGGNDDHAADKAFGGGGDDTYTWTPGDGNDEFHGDAGRDTLNLPEMSWSQLQQLQQSGGLQFYGPALQMIADSSGRVIFVDGQGNPQSFSGQLTVGGETIKFFNVEGFQVRL